VKRVRNAEETSSYRLFPALDCPAYRGSTVAIVGKTDEPIDTLGMINNGLQVSDSTPFNAGDLEGKPQSGGGGGGTFIVSIVDLRVLIV
jgi:hypothetical protein